MQETPGKKPNEAVKIKTGSAATDEVKTTSKSRKKERPEKCQAIELGSDRIFLFPGFPE